MDGHHYDQPFHSATNIPSLLLQTLPNRPRRRRSSLFDRWIQDQHDTIRLDGPSVELTEDLPFATAQSHAYLAYPELHRSIRFDITSDPVPSVSHQPFSYEDTSQCKQPNISGGISNRSSMSHSSPSKSIRSFLSFRAPSSTSTTSNTGTSKADTILVAATPKGHSRSSSMPASDSKSRLRRPSKWRPSILGYFNQPSDGEPVMASSTVSVTTSRPSLSSTHDDTDNGQRSWHDCERSHERASDDRISLKAPLRSPRTSPPNLFHRSPFFLMQSRIPSSLSTESTENNENIDYTNSSDSRPHVAYAINPGTFPRVFRDRKKKKLVISGIGPNDTHRFNGVRRWCETFGEVSQIRRMPNDDLHVYFVKAEVADTVCRLKAKVQISGVGSVALSWYTGTKH